MEGRRTRERPWKQTIPRRGVGESALKLRAVWEGDCREAKVRTGLGKSHGPGSQGGLGKHGYGGKVTPPRNRKSGSGNPPPTVRAPEIYPDRQRRGGAMATAQPLNSGQNRLRYPVSGNAPSHGAATLDSLFQIVSCWRASSLPRCRSVPSAFSAFRYGRPVMGMVKSQSCFATVPLLTKRLCRKGLVYYGTHNFLFLAK